MFRKGKSKPITCPDWQPLHGAYLMIGKQKWSGTGALCSLGLLPSRAGCPLLGPGDYPAPSLAAKGTGTHGGISEVAVQV